MAYINPKNYEVFDKTLMDNTKVQVVKNKECPLHELILPANFSHQDIDKMIQIVNKVYFYGRQDKALEIKQALEVI